MEISYLVYVYKLRVLFIKFENKAKEVLKTKELTKVSDCFQYDDNEVIGLYG